MLLLCKLIMDGQWIEPIIKKIDTNIKRNVWLKYSYLAEVKCNCLKQLSGQSVNGCKSHVIRIRVIVGFGKLQLVFIKDLLLILCILLFINSSSSLPFKPIRLWIIQSRIKFTIEVSSEHRAQAWSSLFLFSLSIHFGYIFYSFCLLLTTAHVMYGLSAAYSRNTKIDESKFSRVCTKISAQNYFFMQPINWR